MMKGTILDLPKNINIRVSDKNMWKYDLRTRIYRINLLQIRKYNNKNIFQQKLIYNQLQINLQKHFFNKKINQNQQIYINQNNLQRYPHGYYSFYIPLTISCKFPDQLTCIFSYFYTLQQQQNINKKDLYYQQISTALVDLDNFMKDKNQQQKNIKYHKFWQICYNKFICQLDSIKKLEIYLELLKYGTIASIKIYKDLKLKCSFDVYQMAILKSVNYLRHKTPAIHTQLQSFSMEQGADINQSALAKTMKMLFCPLCNLYDCGKHEEGDLNIDSQHGYQYVCPNNLVTSTEMIKSILIMMKQREFIFENNIPICNNPCSQRCYRLIKNKEAYKSLRLKRNRHFQEPLTKGIINIGISCFSYDPCLIWSLIDQSKHDFGMTCDVFFVHFMEDQNILKKIQRKLWSSEQVMLQQEQLIQESIIKPIKSRKKDAQYINKQLSVCHHHFINTGSFDLGCRDCACSKRGFCRIECLCTDNCPLKKGCTCKTSQCSANRCICYQSSKQCQPGLCQNCFTYNGNPKINKCKNCVIIQNELCLVRIGKSKIPSAGLGLFAGQNIRSKQLVYTYTGEIIGPEIEAIRETSRQSNDFYNFACHGESIDSRFIGNKARFINHGNQGEDNLDSEIKMAKGMHVIVFFAKRDIAIGQELYFNYDGSGQLFKNHKTKYPFIKKS